MTTTAIISIKAANYQRLFNQLAAEPQLLALQQAKTAFKAAIFDYHAKHLLASYPELHLAFSRLYCAGWGKVIKKLEKWSKKAQIPSYLTEDSMLEHDPTLIKNERNSFSIKQGSSLLKDLSSSQDSSSV